MRKTFLKELFEEDPMKAREYILEALHKNVGEVSSTARWMDVSRPNFWYWLRKLGLNREPERIREHYKRRYRLPPWETRHGREKEKGL